MEGGGTGLFCMMKNVFTNKAVMTKSQWYSCYLLHESVRKQICVAYIFVNKDPIVVFIISIAKGLLQPQISSETQQVRLFQIKCWVQALAVLIHLGLKTGLCAPKSNTRSREPCSFAKVPDGLQTQTLNLLGPRKSSLDMYVCVIPRLHTHTKCGLSFHPLLHNSNLRD